MTIVLTCPHCGRTWPYGGSADRATCPECKSKVPVERFSVEKIDDVLVNLRERVDDLQSDVDSRNKVHAEMKKRIVDLEERIEELEADGGDFGGLDFDSND